MYGIGLTQTKYLIECFYLSSCSVFLHSKNYSIMFTFGIFSTHLPYIFMVCFYAVLLLSGNQKGFSIFSPEIISTTSEITSFTLFSIQDLEDEIFVNTTVDEVSNDYCLFPEFVVQQILFRVLSDDLKPLNYCFAWFTRPPPVGCI